MAVKLLLRALLSFISAIEVAPPEILTVKSLDLNIRENVKAHHTDEFDITDALQNPNKTEFLVVRRGQGFDILVEFNRPYDQENDDLRLVFTFGKWRVVVRTDSKSPLTTIELRKLCNIRSKGK